MSVERVWIESKGRSFRPARPLPPFFLSPQESSSPSTRTRRIPSPRSISSFLLLLLHQMKETLLVPTYLERKSSTRSSCPSLFGSPALLSLITLFLSLRLGRGNDDLWGKGKGSRKGENHRRKRCSPVDRSLITRDCYSSLSRDWSKKKRAKKKKKRSWWLDCRHGSVFEAAHRAHFINGAGRVVDAFVCRLNVAADWPRSYKRGAWLATGRSGTVAPSEGDPCSRPPMFPRLSLSLSPPPVVFRLSTPLLSSSLSPLLRSSIGWSPGVIREQWHFTVFLHLSLFPSAHSFFQVYIELDITIFVDSIYQRRELIWHFVEMNVFSMSR